MTQDQLENVVEIPVTDDTELNFKLHNFPDNLVLIDLGDGKYAANNGTTPDNMTINGLATFVNSEEAFVYKENTQGMSEGTLVRKTFEEARQIAISKPILHAVFLMEGVHVREIHYVR